jgi:hypothetical protein
MTFLIFSSTALFFALRNTNFSSISSCPFSAGGDAHPNKRKFSISRLPASFLLPFYSPHHTSHCTHHTSHITHRTTSTLLFFLPNSFFIIFPITNININLPSSHPPHSSSRQVHAPVPACLTPRKVKRELNPVWRQSSPVGVARRRVQW